jgi:DNA mismatch endonuclease, patch repair protein
MRWQRTAYSVGLSGRLGRNTKPELLLRKALRGAGLGYRLHPALGARLRADVLVVRAKLVIFVDGCFWHQCPKHKPAPDSGANAELWRRKFMATRARDERALGVARAAGYAAMRVFECEIRADIDNVVRSVLKIARRDAEDRHGGITEGVRRRKRHVSGTREKARP